MKITRIQKILFPVLMLALFLGSCADKTLRTYTANTPIYQSLEDWRSTEFAVTSPEPMVHPGKIYIYNDLLFVNEFLKGVHIIDNSNPAAPVKLGFLEVLANVDMAAFNQTLYLDSYSDLLAFDISDVMNPRLIHRVEDVFNFTNYALLEGYNPDYPQARVYSDKGVVLGWNVAEVTEEVETYNYPYYNDIALLDASSFTTNSEASFLGGAGVGGSMARFTIWNEHLYILEPSRLNVFNIAGDPFLVSEQWLSWNAETLFPYDNHLYVGTTTGMLIYDISSPSSPIWRSQFDHVLGCDPVVVSGDRAYVTLAGGRTCGNNVNTLDVVDISNKTLPTLIAAYPMTNPRGLGVDDDLVFVCDGPDGLKIYDRTDDHAITDNLIRHYTNITTNDVIPFNGTLIMTSEEGIYQYSYTDASNITQLSFIAVQP